VAAPVVPDLAVDVVEAVVAEVVGRADLAVDDDRASLERTAALAVSRAAGLVGGLLAVASDVRLGLWAGVFSESFFALVAVVVEGLEARVLVFSLSGLVAEVGVRD
jgi:hypothetical protein